VHVKMKKLTLSHIFVLSIVLMSSCQCYGSNFKGNALKQLQNISHINGSGDNKLFSLIRESSSELVKAWSPELAREIARVFNELLSVNQNYFLVELIDPIIKKYPKQFSSVLQQALSKENKRLYKELVDRDKREENEGNG